jgi:hypothetical protein
MSHPLLSSLLWWTSIDFQRRLCFLLSLGAVESSWDMQCVSPWWQQVRSACVQSHSAAAALLAAIVAHRAAKDNITSLAETKVTHTHTHTNVCVLHH